MDERTQRLLRQVMESNSIQGTIEEFLKEFMCTVPDLPADVGYEVKPSTVFVVIEGVKKSAKMTLAEFGIQVDKIKKDQGFCQFVDLRNINDGTQLMSCVQELEDFITVLIVEYLFAFKDEQEIDDEMIKDQARLEEYLSKAPAAYMQTLRLAIYESYEIKQYKSSQYMDDHWETLLNAPAKALVNSSASKDQREYANDLCERSKFTIHTYLARDHHRRKAKLIPTYQELFILCLDHKLLQMKYGEHYQFSLDDDGKSIRIWVTDKVILEKQVNLCKYWPDKVNGGNYLSPLAKDRALDRDREDYGHKSAAAAPLPGLLEAKEWIFKSMCLFVALVDVAEQARDYIINPPASRWSNAVFFFVASMGAGQRKSYIKKKYNVKDDKVFSHSSNGPFRPYAMMQGGEGIVDVWKRKFFEGVEARRFGVCLLKGLPQPPLSARLSLMKVVDSRLIDSFVLLLKGMERELIDRTCPEDYMKYSKERTCVVLGPFSLLRFLSKDGPGAFRMLLTETIRSGFSQYFKTLEIYFKNSEEQVISDLYDTTKPSYDAFYKKWVFRAFIHAADAFALYPDLLVNSWNLFSILQLHLRTDLINNVLNMSGLSEDERVYAMRYVATQLAAVSGNEKKTTVYKEGGPIAHHLQSTINPLRDACMLGHRVDVCPGSRPIVGPEHNV